MRDWPNKRGDIGEPGVLADGHAIPTLELSIAETLARLRTVATSIDADVPFEATGHRGLDRSQRRYPESVGRAMGEAMGEALRNWSACGAECRTCRPRGIQHRTTRCRCPSRTTVWASIHGVPPERLGIQVSIAVGLPNSPAGARRSAALRAAAPG